MQHAMQKISDCSDKDVETSFEDSFPFYDYSYKFKLSDAIPKNKTIDLQDKDEELSIFLTNNEELLQQYYRMRADYLGDYSSIVDYRQGQTIADKFGKILVIVNKNNQVVAGLRCIMNDGIEYSHANYQNYNIRNFLDEAGFGRDSKCIELSALVTREDHRDFNFTKKMLEFSCNLAEMLRYDYILGFLTKINGRYYRTILNDLNYKTSIMLNYKWINDSIYPMVARVKTSNKVDSVL